DSVNGLVPHNHIFLYPTDLSGANDVRALTPVRSSNQNLRDEPLRRHPRESDARALLGHCLRDHARGDSISRSRLHLTSRAVYLAGPEALDGTDGIYLFRVHF